MKLGRVTKTKSEWTLGAHNEGSADHVNVHV